MISLTIKSKGVPNEAMPGVARAEGELQGIYKTENCEICLLDVYTEFEFGRCNSGLAKVDVLTIYKQKAPWVIKGLRVSFI